VASLGHRGSFPDPLGAPEDPRRPRPSISGRVSADRPEPVIATHHVAAAAIARRFAPWFRASPPWNFFVVYRVFFERNQSRPHHARKGSFCLESDKVTGGAGMRVTIVITNYNFGRYIGDAIRSALDLRWGDKEIIVCDDGSTDESRAVIESFGERVRRVYKANGGQPSAANAAFPLITGDVVFFLDSDDMLLPEAAEAVAKVWDGQTAKVQFPSLIIDDRGADTGKVWPNFREAYRPALIRAALIRTANYPTSSTSGNAFARRFLAQLFPVPEDLEGFDSYLCMTAPFHGDVKTIAEPLAKFRIHDANSWSQLTWQPEKLLFYLDQTTRRDAFVHDWAQKLGIAMNPNSLREDYCHLMYRIACRRIFPQRDPRPQERPRTLVKDGTRAVRIDPFLNRKTKLILTLWFIVVGFAPRRAALWAIKARHVPLSRPRLVQFLLALAGAVGSRRTTGLSSSPL
jgi:glycosyltransferase involved in cell wall biosynthesis